MGQEPFHFVFALTEGLLNGIVGPNQIKEEAGKGRWAHDHGLFIRTGAGDNGSVRMWQSIVNEVTTITGLNYYRYRRPFWQLI